MDPERTFGRGGFNSFVDVDELVENIGLDEAEIEWRKDFIGFNDEDERRLSDLEPLLRDHRGGPPSDAGIRRRFDATSAQLGLDRERARDWVVARSVELGLWSLEAGEDALGNHQLRVAAVLVSSPGRGR